MLGRTLTNGRSKMLTAMFSGDLAVTRTPEDRAFIDRNGKRFGAILDFLRTGDCTELPASGPELARMLEETEFYQARRSSSPYNQSSIISHTMRCHHPLWRP